MNRRQAAIILIVLAAFVLSAWFYSKLPLQVASHWDIHGQVNGYMPRFWGAFLVPLMMLFFALLFWLIPHIDPLGKNIQKFRRQFDVFIAVLLLFLLFIHVQTLLWNIGIEIPLNSTLPIGIGLLFVYIGVLFEHAKRNWFVGIRTPWTLSSDKVWNKTHQLGSKLFKAAGVLAIIGVFFQAYTFWFLLAPIIAAAVITIIYSYLEYRKL